MPTRLAALAFVGTLFVGSFASAAGKYPPGPAYRNCPDTLTIFQTQQSDTLIAPCYPAIGDTVLGVRGIVIGADVRASAFAFYFQTAGGGQFSGLQAFTGASNYFGALPGTPTGGNLVIGDEVAVYGTKNEFPAFNGTSEIDGPDAVQGTNDILVRRLSTGNAVPLDIVTTSQVHWLPAFSQGERYEDGLVRIRGPLRVGRTAAGPGLLSGNYLLTTVASSTDSVLIDNFTMSPTLGGPAPPVGTIVDSVQGIINQSTSATVNTYRLQLRDSNDVFLAVPSDPLRRPLRGPGLRREREQLRTGFGDRRLDRGSGDDRTSTSGGPWSLPKVAGLWTVGPNPSGTGFAARFDLPRDADVRLAVFDLGGRQVASLTEGRFEAGSHERSWRGIDASGRRVPAGVYFCRMSLGERIWTQRWVVVR